MENKITNRIKDLWRTISRRQNEDEEPGFDREKVFVFAISVILAFCLWLIVNLNRDFSLDVQVPVELGNISTDQSLVEELPKEVTASINGTGWNLINVYNDPPHIYVDVSGDEVNLFEQIRQQLGVNSDVTVQTVEPLYLQVQLEPKQSRKVPVRPKINVSFASQYDFVGEPVIEPDSVTIRGAQSRIENINYWPTDSITIKNAKESFSREIRLKEPSSLITLSVSGVTFSGRVEQFTEGEVTVPIQTRDFPVENMISFSPASVQVQYRVPLSEYEQFGNGKTFSAFVDYGKVETDTTGFVSPEIEKHSEGAHLKIRSVRPRQVAYFTIIGN